MSEKHVTSDSISPQAAPGVPPCYSAYYQPHRQAEEDAGIRDYWETVVRYKVTMSLVLIACLCMATAYALIATPIYRAQIVFTPVEQGEQDKMASIAAQFGGLASMAGVSVGGGGGKSSTALAVLKSRNFTTEFISEEKLLPILFDDSKDTPTLWKAFELFDKDVRNVSEDKKNALVTMSIEWKDPALAAKWANELVKRLNRFQREAAIAEADKNIAFLKKELEKTSLVDMRQAIYRLIEAQTKSAMIANVRDEFAFKIIDPAVPPEKKIKPKRAMIVMLGFIGGAFLGLCAVFIRSAIDKSRETGEVS